MIPPPIPAENVKWRWQPAASCSVIWHLAVSYRLYDTARCHMMLPYIYMTLQDIKMTLQDVKLTLQSHILKAARILGWTAFCMYVPPLATKKKITFFYEKLPKPHEPLSSRRGGVGTLKLVVRPLKKTFLCVSSPNNCFRIRILSIHLELAANGFNVFLFFPDFEL